MRANALLLLFVVLGAALAVTPQYKLKDSYKNIVDTILSAAQNDTQGFQRLTTMCDTYGPRLSGSTSLEYAIDWLVSEMLTDSLDNVHTENVMVPHWVRGSESLEMRSPRQAKMGILGLGGSVATPPGGITAEVLVVQSFDELASKASQAKGKIVVFNVPFQTYGVTVIYRTNGAAEAAKYGAVASLTRSITPESLYTPHTGSMSYSTNTSIPRIPAAAITIEDAELLQRLQGRGFTPILHLYMEAMTLPDSLSRNVIAEIRGSTKPEEIVVIGGHIDSWDVGTGAHDDGGGCLMAYQALNILKNLGLRAQRTIRVVLFTNEENGTRGAKAYYNDNINQINNTVFAMESDSGTFTPIGLSFAGTSKALGILQSVADLLSPVVNLDVTPGGAGADITPLTDAGVPGAGLVVSDDYADDKYFYYHHTNADTIDKIDPVDFGLGLGTMAAVAYVIADMPTNLPRD